MLTYTRQLSYALLFAALLLGAAACSSPTTGTKPQEPADQKPKPPPSQPVKITAEELTKSFKDDFDAAYKKYPLKTVMEVTGVIKITLVMGRIRLEGFGKEPPMLYCHLEKDPANLKTAATLAQGQKITLRGILEGNSEKSVKTSGVVQLFQCQLIDPKP